MYCVYVYRSMQITVPKGRAKKFPSINQNYESKDHTGMFIAGTASHSLDFRKSAGGFIHGFRYTGKNKLLSKFSL